VVEAGTGIRHSFGDGGCASAGFAEAGGATDFSPWGSTGLLLTKGEILLWLKKK